MEPQVALTLPLLEGTDGVQKMSKSYGNYIGLTDEPNDMFGKVMSIPDEAHGEILPFRLPTVSVSEIDEIERGLAARRSLHPSKVKRSLARNIVAAYYDEDAASAAEADFDLKFKEHGFPEHVSYVRGRFDVQRRRQGVFRASSSSTRARLKRFPRRAALSTVGQ